MARRKVEAEPEAEAPAASEIEKTLADIRKTHGKACVGERVQIANHFSTGIFPLDFALGGGYAEGYVAMLVGAESSGKTTNAYRAIASWQRKCRETGCPSNRAVFVDVEGSYDSMHAERVGVDTSLLEKIVPPHGQAACDIYLAVVESKEVGIVVLDTVAACAPEKVLINSLSDETRSELPRLMTTFAMCLTTALARERQRDHIVTPILINQLRVMQGVMYGDNTGFPGGNYINKHLPTSTVMFRKNKKTEAKDSLGFDVADGYDHTFQIRKSKHFPELIRGGEYFVVASPDSATGVPIAGIDEAPTLRAFSQKFGFIEGRFKLPAIFGDEQFAKLSDIEIRLTDDATLRYKLSRLIIAAQRKRLGMPELPPDGYLITK